MLARTVASALPSLIHALISAACSPRQRVSPSPLVPGWRWRWCRYCAGDCAKRATGCRPDCSAGSAASRSADRRAGPRTDQAAADRSLAGVIGVCARRQTERQRQRNPARSNTKCLSHVLTRSARDCPDNTTRLGQVPPAASSTAIAIPRNRTGTQGAGRREAVILFGPEDDVWCVAVLLMRPAGDADVPPNEPRAVASRTSCTAVAILVLRRAGTTALAKRPRSSS
jgi:hypothetical protein